MHFWETSNAVYGKFGFGGIHLNSFTPRYFEAAGN
jgi:hypothetical protein